MNSAKLILELTRIMADATTLVQAGLEIKEKLDAGELHEGEELKKSWERVVEYYEPASEALKASIARRMAG